MSAARLEGKVAIITGASRGIGKGIALELAARGASITVNYNNSASAVKAVVEEIEKLGSRAVAIKADVSSFPDIEKLFNEAHKHISPGGRIVMMSSISATIRGLPDHAIYSASKAAIEAMVRSLPSDFSP